MNQEDLKDHIVKIISNQRTGVLSSVENNKPHSRYMTFYNDDLTLFTPTKKDTEKIEEMKKNPSVSILLGYEGKGIEDAYVEISGKAMIKDSPEAKTNLWNDSFSTWFNGPEDPNYVLLQIQPEVIRLLNIHGEPSQKLIL
ncbi:pyridoxamine 5'-phosphate oxidase family protein [Cytobacillus massiliigabonensis]|uniref:pyridoxamine 5'-phosphate oxidase family protein n=1 Tax=Cytobacillus massiliigabonensis TaxID=1871011 RepID=UPI000C82E78D|nr:pyridoxamine 5'-phosphate oxidase family protein [Cytobacillus massiliigabonensis]